jgi:hypothetical protein
MQHYIGNFKVSVHGVYLMQPLEAIKNLLKKIGGLIFS